MAHDVFISYSHEDRTVANAVVATLESRGIRCWIAPRDIIPGEDWGSAIIDALKEAHALVLIFSSHSNESEQIKREVERTVHQGIAVIPFRIEDVLPSKTLEYFISTQHWLDALTPPLEDHLAHLANTIQVLLAKKGFGEKPPTLERDEPAPPLMEKRPEVPPKEPPPPIMASAPPRQVPIIWLGALAGLLVVLLVAAGLWWHWSQPVVSPPPAPAPVAPVAKAPVTPAPPAPAPPVTTTHPAPQQPAAQQPATPATPPGPVVRVEDGKFIIAPETERWKVVLNQDTILPNNMDASVSLTFQKANDPTFGSGLIFWAKDFTNFYVLALTPAGDFGIQHYAAKRWLTPVGWRKIDSARKGENVENILRVVTKGNEATAYVNGQEIISFTGEPPQEGSLIGLKGSSGPKGGNAAAFTNLKIIAGSQVYGFHPDPQEPTAIKLFKKMPGTADAAQSLKKASLIPPTPPGSPESRLKEPGKMTRGAIGVQVQKVTPELAQSLGLAEPKGALVVKVNPGGPAEKAGLRGGDIILEFNGRPIWAFKELPPLVIGTPPGTKVTLKVLLQGTEQGFTLMIAESKEEPHSLPGSGVPGQPLNLPPKS
jgi:hypothetical protein